MVLGRDAAGPQAAPVDAVLTVDHAALKARSLPYVQQVLGPFPGVVQVIDDRQDPFATMGRRAAARQPGQCACGHDDRWVQVPIHGGQSVRVDCGHCDRFGFRRAAAAACCCENRCIRPTFFPVGRAARDRTSGTVLISRRPRTESATRPSSQAGLVAHSRPKDPEKPHTDAPDRGWRQMVCRAVVGTTGRPTPSAPRGPAALRERPDLNHSPATAARPGVSSPPRCLPADGCQPGRRPNSQPVVFPAVSHRGAAISATHARCDLGFASAGRAVIHDAPTPLRKPAAASV
jgi:hypothetical protein